MTLSQLLEPMTDPNSIQASSVKTKTIFSGGYSSIKRSDWLRMSKGCIMTTIFTAQRKHYNEKY